MRPLRRLASLRTYGGQESLDKWMKTEMRQNLKAIQDAFERLSNIQESGNFSFDLDSTSYATLTPEVRIITTGGKVDLRMVPGSTQDGAAARLEIDPNIELTIGFTREGPDGSIYIGSEMVVGHTDASAFINFPVSSLRWLDEPPAGSYIYRIRYKVTGGSSLILRSKLIAQEF